MMLLVQRQCPCAAYVVSIGMLFPCAVMVSVASYRVSNAAKYGVAAYTSGCSAASLLVAQLLGWPAFTVFSICWFVALSLVRMVVSDFGQFFCLAQNGNTPLLAYANMPGTVAAGLSFMLQLTGLATTAYVSTVLKKMRGVGCNSGGCLSLSAVVESLDPTSASALLQYQATPLPAGRQPLAGAKDPLERAQQYQ